MQNQAFYDVLQVNKSINNYLVQLKSKALKEKNFLGIKLNISPVLQQKQSRFAKFA